MNFKRLNQIISSDADINNDIFITLDMDWCTDQVMCYTLEVIEENDVSATIFVTHDSPVLKEMQSNPNIELGIHPNFNPLLSGDFKYGRTAEEVVDYYMDIFPGAVSVRSHSVTNSSQISQIFASRGLLIESNSFIPFDAQMSISIWANQGLTIVPYFFADDLRVNLKWEYSPKEMLDRPGLKVFDFHPIHIFLNTANVEGYNKCKPYYHNTEKLKKFINNDCYGTKDFFVDLIKEVRSR